MVQLCVAYGCNSTPVKGTTLHEFPKDVERCWQWVQFVQRTRVWESKPRTSHICSKHFCREVIANYLEVEMGVAKRLVLIEDAVPMINPNFKTGAKICFYWFLYTKFQKIVCTIPLYLAFNFFWDKELGILPSLTNFNEIMCQLTHYACHITEQAQD